MYPFRLWCWQLHFFPQLGLSHPGPREGRGQACLSHVLGAMQNIRKGRGQGGTLSSYENVSLPILKPCEGMAWLMGNQLLVSTMSVRQSLPPLALGDVCGSVWNHCMSSLVLHLSWVSVWPRGSLPSVSLSRSGVKKGFYLRWEYLELTIDICHWMSLCFCPMKYQEWDWNLILGTKLNDDL
jgi:hypothetical protein